MWSRIALALLLFCSGAFAQPAIEQAVKEQLGELLFANAVLRSQLQACQAEKKEAK